MEDQRGETVKWEGNFMQIGSFFRTSGTLTGKDEKRHVPSKRMCEARPFLTQSLMGIYCAPTECQGPAPRKRQRKALRLSAGGDVLCQMGSGNPARKVVTEWLQQDSRGASGNASSPGTGSS